MTGQKDPERTKTAPSGALTRTERNRAEFIAAMGRNAQAEGLSPIAGRIISLLVFDGQVYSFGDLAIALKVSRASISNNTRFLVEQGILDLIKRPGDRRDHFRLSPKGLAAMLRGVEMRARRAESMIRSTAEALDEGEEARSARLADLAEFYGTLANAFHETVRRSADKPKDGHRIAEMIKPSPTRLGSYPGTGAEEGQT